MRIRKPLERWFPALNDPDKAEVKIRHLTPGELQDIVDNTVDDKVIYSKNAEGQLEPQFEHSSNRRKSRELALVARIVDWKNMFDEKGKELKCNETNIIRAAREIDGFIDFINECVDQLSKDLDSEKKDQEKN